jgi:hypothetical protein
MTRSANWLVASFSRRARGDTHVKMTICVAPTALGHQTPKPHTFPRAGDHPFAASKERASQLMSPRGDAHGHQQSNLHAGDGQTRISITLIDESQTESITFPISTDKQNPNQPFVPKAQPYSQVAGISSATVPQESPSRP